MSKERPQPQSARSLKPVAAPFCIAPTAEQGCTVVTRSSRCGIQIVPTLTRSERNGPNTIGLITRAGGTGTESVVTTCAYRSSTRIVRG